MEKIFMVYFKCVSSGCRDPGRTAKPCTFAIPFDLGVDCEDHKESARKIQRGELVYKVPTQCPYSNLYKPRWEAITYTGCINQITKLNDKDCTKTEGTVPDVILDRFSDLDVNDNEVD